MTPQQLTLLCKWLHSENWVGYMRSFTSNICTAKSPTIQSRLIYPSCKYNHIMKKWRKWNVKSSSPPGQGCRCMQQKLTPSQKVHFADDYYLCWPPVSAQHLITYRFTVQYHTMLENSQYTYLTPPALSSYSFRSMSGSCRKLCWWALNFFYRLPIERVQIVGNWQRDRPQESCCAVPNNIN